MTSLLNLLNKYPKPSEKAFRYGTAGFRENAANLDSVFLRMGMLAWMRAVHTKQSIGVMTTASHNLVKDNGVKMIDPDGGMLEAEWEKHAEKVANAEKAEDVVQVFRDLITKLGINVQETDGSFTVVGDANSRVLLARDTRPHSAHLSGLLLQGAECIGGTVEDYGLLTTPQLHFIVQHTNLGEEMKKYASPKGYYDKLSTAYKKLVDGLPGGSPEVVDLIVDAGFGIGGLKFRPLMDQVNSESLLLNVLIRNVASDEDMKQEDIAQKLNNGVGAEHVQKQRLLPKNTIAAKEKNIKCASFDGDADRIVYYYVDEEGKMILQDGDKLASLLAGFVSKQLAKLPDDIKKKFSLGAVQTAYANGASMTYLKDTMKLEAPLVATGVKHCHHKALEFDVGVYFEANGHGTVLFKAEMIKFIKSKLPSLKGEALVAAERIINMSELINQAAGDAMADALAIEAILKIEKQSIQSFAALYDDLPSRQLKVRVKDRSKIKTTKDESQATSPAALQPAIDVVVGEYKEQCGRAFVRPSGTEDVVRIYAEAKTQELADQLAWKICQVAYDNAGGIGERPQQPTK